MMKGGDFMTLESGTKRFDEIYQSTYQSTLRFIICKCQNINDANDILQETYLELYKILNKKRVDDINLEVYMIRIAGYKVKKYYSLLQRLKYKRMYSKHISEEIDDVKDDINIEQWISDKSLCEEIWKFVKSKNELVQKVFYLRFSEELSIKEIADILAISESSVKNNLYRVLKEINIRYGKEENNEFYK